jgi:hypothetical protein
MIAAVAVVLGVTKLPIFLPSSPAVQYHRRHERHRHFDLRYVDQAAASCC